MAIAWIISGIVLTYYLTREFNKGIPNWPSAITKSLLWPFSLWTGLNSSKDRDSQE